ncbi:helix-turn-helix domain-containing protein [Defluviimonas sp. WL0024]|uniref:Helix-turn-helix domain-containing protein n=1 Tax=Albidovulum salinarum TaxID=2984153 RepID=A0ABT2X058_9RHOB|nr:helix-turn-helix domain-containing protein [Defluviimonas sp. WL0024]MCU9847317.1 helix-turn-helix domain-containing protein [Defluviimonas sp. WL0024]
MQLAEYLQSSEAWAAMKPTPRALYVELRRRFNGANNGDIFLSVRDAARALNVSKDTAHAAFRDLVERGFIRLTEGGHLGPSGIGKAAKWALEEEPTRDGKPATKSFMRWQEEKQNPVRKSRTPRPENSDGTGVNGASGASTVRDFRTLSANSAASLSG